MHDGIILIKLLNKIDENAVDMRVVNKYVNGEMNIFKLKGNINTAITACKGIIKCVGVNETAFLDKNPTIILSVLTQLVKKLTSKNINLMAC